MPRNILVIGVFAVVGLLFLLSLFALSRRIHRFVSGFRTSQTFGNKNRRAVFWIISLVPALLLVVYFIFDKINAIIVAWHFSLICLLYDTIFFFVQKIFRIKKKNFFHDAIPIVLSILYLTVGFFNCQNVSRTEYRIFTQKEFALKKLRIALIADSHLGATFNADGFAKHLARIQAENADALFISGDFVDDDTSRANMIKACDALKEFSAPLGKYFVFGNHDKGYFSYRDFSTEDLVCALTESGVTILEDEIAPLAENLYVAGRKDATESRISATELLSSVPKNAFVIVLNHQPTDYAGEAESEADLVLSGHTHGGQLIPIGLICKLFNINDSIYGHQKKNKTNFIVTSGISDWAIKFKTGTKSEYVVIDVEKN